MIISIYSGNLNVCINIKFFSCNITVITLWVKGWNLFYEISEKRRKLYYAKMSFWKCAKSLAHTQVMLMEWQKLNANTSLYFPLFTVILMKELQYVDN